MEHEIKGDNINSSSDDDIKEEFHSAQDENEFENVINSGQTLNKNFIENFNENNTANYVANPEENHFDNPKDIPEDIEIQNLNINKQELEFSKLLNNVQNDKEQRKRLEEIISYLKVQKQPFQESELLQIFDRLDTDSDNAISSKEIKRFLNSLRSPVNDYYIEKMLKDFDSNKSGDIQKNEFLAKMKNVNNKGSGSDLTELLEIFKLFDANHDDIICDQDLQNMLKALGENFDQNTCKEMMRHLGDANGVINFSKFFELVKDEDK